jgi:CBS domain containing-hemolysin-like protein
MNGAILSQYAGQLLGMLILLAASAFFSGSETALFSLTRGQLQRLRRGAATGRLVAALMRQPQRTLNTLLLGNMLVNVAYAAIAAVTVLDLRASGASAWVIGTVSVVPLIALILLGEATPKMLAILTAERWALLVAGPLMIVRRALSPLLWCAEHLAVLPLTRMLAPQVHHPSEVTTDELGAVLELSARRGILDRDANELLQEIVELSDLRVADIMVPRVDMIAYDLDGSREGLIELFRQTRLRRIPVYEGHIDAVLGMVHAKRLLLNPDASLRELVVKVPFVPEAGSVERALLQFRVTRTQMAIVVDEYGGTAGLVTLEDALEQIVGDIPDARDEATGPAVERISPRQYVLDGDLAIHEWVDAFKMDLAGKRISTVGGFVTSLLGHIPRVGQEAAYGNLRFRVESMRGRRIGKLRLELTGGES